MAASLTVTGSTSQNGWPASPRGSDIGIVTLALRLRNGAKTVQVAEKAADAFREIIEWWDANVEPVETLGGYNYREIRGYEGSGTISNHGSGTAIDINATRHPLGATGTVSSATAVQIIAKAASLGLKWGGAYRGRKDPMHFEVVLSPTTDMIRKTATNYWWVTFIAGAAIAGAVIYRHRFRS